MQDFRGLLVWQKAHRVALEVYRVTREFPPEERFGAVSQIRRSSASVAANLAEGCARGTDQDFTGFVQIAIGSAAETEYHLLLARDLGWLKPDDHFSLQQRLDEIRRMLISLHSKLKGRKL